VEQADREALGCGSDSVSLATDDFVKFPSTGTFLSSSLIGKAIGEWAQILPPRGNRLEQREGTVAAPESHRPM
jgi:hypothetical protein